MEDRSLGSGAEHAPPLEGPYGERRRRAQDMLAAQDAYLDRLESTITEQLQQLASEVAQSVALAEAANTGRGDADAIAAMQTQYDSLKQQYHTLDAEAQALRQQLEQAQVARVQNEQELRVRDALLKEMQASDEQRRVELATLREQLADLQAQLTAARARVQAVDQGVESQREELEAKLEDTKAQRRRIAREFKQQRAELEEQKAELQRLGASRNTQLEAELAELKAELAQAAERHAAELISSQQNSGSNRGADPAEVRELSRQVELLESKLAAAEARLAERPGADAGDPRKRDDLQRRFEMAVEEVRELKRANADLENKLKSRSGGSSPAAAVGGGGLNWEAQKQKLLASLEADSSDDDDEDDRAERASIETTIQMTDRVVAQKDREIEALRQQLEQQGAGGGSRSAAINELLDSDEIIRLEREKLVALQQEWRQKIGEAEIEISVQRAKLARERSELDEKLRQLQIEQDNRPPGAGGEDTADTTKPARGKWLARLGLKDIDEPGKKS